MGRTGCGAHSNVGLGKNEKTIGSSTLQGFSKEAAKEINESRGPKGVTGSVAGDLKAPLERQYPRGLRAPGANR